MIECTNVATGEVLSICLGQYPTLDDVRKALVGKDSKVPNDAKFCKILIFCGIDISTKDVSTKIRDLPNPANQPLSVTFAYLHDFKAIVRLFRTSGVMADSILALLTVGSVDEIRAAQNANHIIRAGAGGQQLS